MQRIGCVLLAILLVLVGIGAGIRIGIGVFGVGDEDDYTPQGSTPAASPNAP
jgi:hypothetical protein